LTEFGQHTPAWLDALIRCTGIHDFTTSSTSTSSSSFYLTPLQRRFLANGLRFICTPPKSQLQTFSSHISPTAGTSTERSSSPLGVDSTTGWPRFCRTLTSRLLLHPEDGQRKRVQQTRVHEKFRLRGRHPQCHFLAQLEESHRGESTGSDLTLVDQYRAFTLPLLHLEMARALRRSLSQRCRINVTPKEKEFIQCLVQDAAVTCKPADKNLGLVLVDTVWYVGELRRMLSDRITYSIVKTGSNPPVTLRKLQDRLLNELHNLTKKHKNTIFTHDPVHADVIENFLLHRIRRSGTNAAIIPTIYGIIKVHKPRLSMRPIVPCTRSVTTPASVVVDELLQQVLRSAKIPWIVKDTKSLINELEACVLPTQEGELVTADIASLYTNIDTIDGLTTIDLFLSEQHLPSDLHRFIMDLLRFVMMNSYLSFRDTVYHQIDGTAMGTACAPTYANIYVFMKERSIVLDMVGSSVIRIYKRFLDDVFAFIAKSHVEEFKTRMNQLHPKLKFEFVTHSNEAVFLDLMIHKGRRFYESSIFDLRVHQKSMNLYLYIPWNSFHTDAAKRSFVQTELIRYVRNSSDREDYLRLRTVFYERLRDRGYPHSFLRPLFTGVVLYSDRQYFLYPSSDLAHHPTIYSHPPKSTCLQRRLERVARVGRSTHDAVPPPIFVTSDNPLSRMIPIRKILSHHWSILTTIQPNLPRPIIAYKTWPSLATTLVFQKAKKNEEQRLKKFTQSTATLQVKIDSYFTRRKPV
jgi:hypothetical protein